MGFVTGRDVRNTSRTKSWLGAELRTSGIQEESRGALWVSLSAPLHCSPAAARDSPVSALPEEQRGLEKDISYAEPHAENKG